MSKLVRDRIPDIIRANGEEPKIKIASTREYRRVLHAKLKEEVQEFLRDRNVEELADIQEVINAIAKEYKWNVERVRKKKAKDRGGFAKRFILVSKAGRR